MAKKLYEILGVEDNASRGKIERAYRKLLRANLSDKHTLRSELDQKKQEFTDAYNLLKDPEKRKQYDAGLINERGRPVGEKEKNYMGLVEKYYDFLNQAIDDFTYVKKQPGTSKENVEFLDSKISFFKSLRNDLKPLGDLARTPDAYNAKYEEMYPEFRNGLASAWRQIYELSATEPAEDKLKPDYMPSPQDYKLVASKLMPEWKVSDNPFSMVSMGPVLVESFVETPEQRIETGQQEVIEPSVVISKQEKQQQVETKPFVTQKSETGQPVHTEPFVPSPKPVETKPVQPQPLVDNHSIHNLYKYRTLSQNGGREHSHEINGQAFGDLKARYQTQRGDYLKTNILEDFRLQIQNADSPRALEDLVKDLKQSPEYKALATAQRGTMRFFSQFFEMETSAVKAFNEMVDEKKVQLGNPSIKPG